MTAKDSLDEAALAGRDELPNHFADLRALIVEKAPSLPKRLAQVAEFAVSHPQEIAFGTLAEIAAQADVQPSTLVRFAQALGYGGFSDLQRIFRTHARHYWPDYRERLEAMHNDAARKGGPERIDAIDLLAGFMQAATESVHRLGATIDAEALQRAVHTLARARTIYLLGLRRAYPVLAYLAYALRKLEVPCQLVDHGGGLAPEQVGLIGPDEAVLAVSFTPYAPATLELASTAFRQNVPVVAITDSPFSPLVQASTSWLEVTDADHLAFRSLAGSFVLATTLAVAVAEARRR